MNNKKLRNKKRNNRFISFILSFTMVMAFMTTNMSIIIPDIAEAVGLAVSDFGFDREVGGPFTPDKMNNAIQINNSGSNKLYATFEDVGQGTEIFNNFPPNSGLNNNYVASGSSSINMSVYMKYEIKVDLTTPDVLTKSPQLYIDSRELFGHEPGKDPIFKLLDTSSKTGNISDQEYYEEKGIEQAGTYEIHDDGYISFSLTPEFVSYVKSSGTGDVKGSIAFSGELSSSSSEGGDQQFNFGGIPVTVKFPEKKPTVSKVGEIQNGKYHWTITISKPDGVNLSNYKISDTMLSMSSATGLKSTPSGLISPNGDLSNTAVETITIEYDTTITPDQLKNGVTNNVDLKKKADDTVVSSDSAQISKSTFAVDKKGTPDYDTPGGSRRQKINWEIKINNPDKIDLKDFIIEDSEIPATFTSNKLTKLEDEDVKWRVNTSTTDDLVINYTTDAKGGNNSNNVKLLYPNSNDVAGSGNKTVNYVLEKDLYNLTKSGQYNQDTHQITWKVTVKTKNGDHDLNGYTVTDDKDYNGIKFISLNNNSISTEKASQYYTMNGKTITFGEGLKEATFEYVENVTPSNQVQTVENEIHDEKGNSSTGSVDVSKARNELRKSLSGSANQNIISKTSKEVTNNWTVVITRDDNFNGYKYVDTITPKNASSVVVGDIVVKGGTTQSEMKVLSSSDYTIVNKSGAGFEIVFNSSVDAKKINYIQIDYPTTSTLTAPTEENSKIEASISNEGKLTDSGGQGVIGPSTATYNATVEHPTITKNVPFNKEWSPSPDTFPQSISVEIWYDTGSSPEGVVKSPKKLTFNNGNPDYSGNSGNPEIVITPDGTNNWKRTFENLKIREEDVNGNIIYYYYKIIETKIGDRAVQKLKADDYTDGSLFLETDNGSYYVDSWSGNLFRENGVENLNIKNEYTPNYNATIKKVFQNIADDDNPIKEVICGVKYRVNSGEYKELHGIGAEYRFDFDNNYDNLDPYKFTITKEQWVNGVKIDNLPAKKLINNTVCKIEYIVYEKAIVTDSGETIEINSDNNFVMTDGYFSTNLGQVNYDLINTKESAKNIENVWHKKDNVKIKINKNWANDKPENRPYSVYVKIEKKTDKDPTWVSCTGDNDYIEIIGDKNNNYWQYDYSNPIGNNFEIDETGQIIKIYYRVTEVGYKQTESSAPIYFADNSKYFRVEGDDEGYYAINNPDVISTEEKLINSNISNTYKTDDVIPKMALQKAWKGDFENRVGRPNAVWLKLQVSEDGIEWTDVDLGNIDDVETESISGQKAIKIDTSKYAEYTIGNTTVEQSQFDTILKNLPGTKLETVTNEDDGTISYKLVSYQYRLVEIAYANKSGQPVAIKENSKFESLNGGGTYTPRPDGTISIDSPTYGENVRYLKITNDFTERNGVVKTALDKNGDELTSISISELKDVSNGYKKEIDGEWYYVFNWMIEYKGRVDASDNANEKAAEFYKPTIDTLPDGHTLIYSGLTVNKYNKDNQFAIKVDKDKTDIENGFIEKGYYNNPEYVIHKEQNSQDYIVENIAFDNNEISVAFQLTPESRWNFIFEQPIITEGNQYNEGNTPVYYYDENDEDVSRKNKILFSIGRILHSWEYPYQIKYSTKIKCSDLEGLLGTKRYYSFTNTAETFNRDKTPTGSTDSATIKVTNDIPSDLIKKDYTPGGMPGYIKYSLDINPDGKNLSNGSTIDITDIFDTKAYIDSDIGASGERTTGSHLVDTLLSRLKVYKVDIYGLKTELNSTEYTMSFDSGVDVSEGSSLLKLVIPDEEHIIIEYEYKLIANSNTPSVKNGCLSSTRINGRPAKMAVGFVPPAGDIVELKNSAYLETEAVSESAVREHDSYEVSKSNATISTTKIPKIVKVNTGDKSVKNLDAEFYLAKYVDGMWYYVTDINNKTVTWGDTGYSETSIDESAVKLSVNTDYKNMSDEQTLFKIIEVNVPDGYEGSNLELSQNEFEDLIKNYLNNVPVDDQYKDFLSNYKSTYYFTIKEKLQSYPSGVKPSEVMLIKSGENIEIPNNQLLNIKVTKNWVQPITDTNATIRVKLYWSYKKDTVGMPNDAVPVEAKDLGIINPEFTNPIDISAAEKETAWNSVPNGKDGKPIYYYIEEVGYTIDGKYTEVKDGQYKPTYFGNAVNLPNDGDDSLITINNSSELILRKEWKDSMNQVIPSDKLSAKKITVSIYGVDYDGNQDTNPLIENVSLEALESWQSKIELDDSIDLSMYKSFVAVENGTTLSSFIVSCVSNLNGNTGEIVVTNKGTEQIATSAYVKKEWSDGLDKHDGIEVKLYQSTKKYNGSDCNIIKAEATAIEGTDTEPVTLNSDNNWEYLWTNLEIEDEAKNPYYYYVIEELPDDTKYVPVYSYDTTQGYTNVTITNTRNSILVRKEWIDESGKPIVNVCDEDGNVLENKLKDFETINVLVLKDGEELDTPIQLGDFNNWTLIYDVDDSGSYTFVEDGAKDGWTVSYDNNENRTGGSSEPVVIKNTKESSTTSIKVVKTWSNDTETDRPDEILFNLYRATEYNEESESKEKLEDSDEWVWWYVDDVPTPSPDKVDDTWTFVYSNLPSEDIHGHTYRYKVEERKVDDYKVTYGPEAKEGVTNVNEPLMVVNTKVFSMKIEKMWSDGADKHMDQTIKVGVYRSTTKDEEPQNIILNVNNNTADYKVYIPIDSSEQYEINSNVNIKISKSGDCIDSIVGIGKHWNVNLSSDANYGDEAVLTIVTDDKQTLTVTVVLTSLSMEIDDKVDYAATINPVLKYKGESISNSDVVKFTFDPEGIVEVDENGKLKAVGVGTTKITAKYNEDPTGIAEASVTVKYPKFEVPNIINVELDGTSKISPDPNYGTFEYKSKNENIATVDNDGKIKGISEGSTVIRVIRDDGVEKAITVNVVDYRILADNYKVTTGANIETRKIAGNGRVILILKGSPNTGYQLQDTTSNEKLDGTFDDNGYKTIDYDWNSNADKITFVSYYSPHPFEIVSAKFYPEGTSPAPTPTPTPAPAKAPQPQKAPEAETEPPVRGTLTVFTSNIRRMGTARAYLLSTAPNGGDDGDDNGGGNSPNSTPEPYKTIELKYINDFKAVVEDLDIKDSEGKDYYYWVKEIDAPAGYSVSYSFKDGDESTTYSINADDKGDNPLITIKNTLTETPVELPETGGEGTKPYTAAGLAIMLSSVSIYYLYRRVYRRRRWKSA